MQGECTISTYLPLRDQSITLFCNFIILRNTLKNKHRKTNEQQYCFLNEKTCTKSMLVLFGQEIFVCTVREQGLDTVS